MNNIIIHVLKIILILVILVSAACKKENMPPVATFTISPEEGDIESFFVFNATGCTDKEDGAEDLMVRWDWESDGSWDTQYSTNKIEQKKFSNTTTYTITLEVKDISGMISTTSKQLVITGLVSGSLIDTRDGKMYKTMKIGNQWWMVENLNYETLDISWCYNDVPANCNLYGRLYSHPAIVYACPLDWHLPSDEEWKELEVFLGMYPAEVNDVGDRSTGEVGDKLRSVSGWDQGFNGNNESKFNALSGGFGRVHTDQYGNIYEDYEELGLTTIFWTSTETNYGYFWIRRLFTSKVVARYRLSGTKSRLYIRCVKD